MKTLTQSSEYTPQLTEPVTGQVATELTPSSSSDQRLLMIYVSIPFCRSKCAFCDYVQPIPVADLLLTAQDSTRQNYVKSLCAEIRARGSELASDKKVRYVPHVLYWGGGTASILEPHEISEVMQALRGSFDLSSIVEATIECSPETISPEKLALFRALGFNRFSSGVQSFSNERLRHLGRRHTAEGAVQAVAWAREAGFESLNVDIMCGFPDEPLDEVRHTVSQALSLKLDHLSVYPFRPTPGTALRGMIDRDRKDLYLQQQKLAFAEARRMISSAGYEEYASGYFGQPSLFAVQYFQMSADIVGFGSGAMSFYGGRFRTHAKGKIREYIADPTHYEMDIPGSAEPVVISSLRAGLSYFEGVSRTEWQKATGVPLEDAVRQPAIERLTKYLRGRGLVEDEAGLRLPASEVGNILIDLNFQLLQ